MQILGLPILLRQNKKVLSGSLTQSLFPFVKTLAYQFRSEPFVLSSGKESNYYFDCKRVTMNPESLHLTAKAFRDELIPQSGISIPQAVGGLTLGSDPIAYALSLSYWEIDKKVYPLVVRKEEKDHGTSRLVESGMDFPKATKALVLEDTTTTGSSSLKAVQALRNLGLQVDTCLAIMDREEGAKEALLNEDVNLFSLFAASDFIR